MPEFESLSRKVKQIRHEMKESQMDFAYHCGISMDTLSLIERQKIDTRLGTIQKIAAYVGITVSELLEVENESIEKETKTS